MNQKANICWEGNTSQSEARQGEGVLRPEGVGWWIACAWHVARSKENALTEAANLHEFIESIAEGDPPIPSSRNAAHFPEEQCQKSQVSFFAISHAGFIFDHFPRDSFGF